MTCRCLAPVAGTSPAAENWVMCVRLCVHRRGPHSCCHVAVPRGPVKPERGAAFLLSIEAPVPEHPRKAWWPLPCLLRGLVGFPAGLYQGAATWWDRGGCGCSWQLESVEIAPSFLFCPCLLYLCPLPPRVCTYTHPHTHTCHTHRKGGFCWAGSLPAPPPRQMDSGTPPTFFLRLGPRHLRVYLLLKQRPLSSPREQAPSPPG